MLQQCSDEENSYPHSQNAREFEVRATRISKAAPLATIEHHLARAAVPCLTPTTFQPLYRTGRQV